LLQKISFPNPWKLTFILCGKRIFENMTKLKIMSWGDYPVLLRCSVSAIHASLKEKESFYTWRPGDEDGEGKTLKIWALRIRIICSHKQKNADRHQKVEDTRNRLSLGTLERRCPKQCLAAPYNELKLLP
jgi:hypothetical protein